jgi:cytoskeletal protein CcmA (bactofilin family)
MSRDEDIDKTETPVNPKLEKTSSLGSKLVCKGEISGEEDLVIKGRIKGTIMLRKHSLFIEKDALVEADVTAANVVLSGSLTGNIYASGKAFLSPEARMKGDIVAAKVSIRDGAQFMGSIRMNKGGL